MFYFLLSLIEMQFINVEHEMKVKDLFLMIANTIRDIADYKNYTSEAKHIICVIEG